MNDCKCGHSLRDHEYSFEPGELQPCTKCSCTTFEEEPHFICNDCERRPRAWHGRCYYDLLKRHHVGKTSIACDNLRRKKNGIRKG